LQQKLIEKAVQEHSQLRNGTDLSKLKQLSKLALESRIDLGNPNERVRVIYSPTAKPRKGMVSDLSQASMGLGLLPDTSLLSSPSSSAFETNQRASMLMKGLYN